MKCFGSNDIPHLENREANIIILKEEKGSMRFHAREFESKLH